MATVLDVVTGALQRLGVLAESETPTAGQSADALTRLNELIDDWAANRLQIYSITRTTWTLVSGTASYTVGSGGTVNVARPVFVQHVNYQDTSLSPVLEMRMNPLTDDAYANIALKTQTSVYPSNYWYNPTYPTATLTLWPVPTSSTLQGVLYASTAVGEFAALSTSVALPPGYKRMIETNLAVELAPEYNMEPSTTLVQAAINSMSTVKRANIRLMDLSIDNAALIQVDGAAGFYNIWSDV